MVTLSDIPDDLLARAFANLGPWELCVAEATCRRFRRVTRDCRVWETSLEREVPGLLHLWDPSSGILDPLTRTPAEGQGMGAAALAKRVLCRALDGTRVQDLLRDVVLCSSCDNPEEHPRNTLEEPSGARPTEISYWSSRGSDDPESSEIIVYRTDRVCILRELIVQPYSAWFQEGFPTYAPKRVRLRACTGDSLGFQALLHPETKEAAPGRAEIVFDVEQSPVPQTFRIEPPLPCAGLVHVEFEGRRQVQAMDQLHYTCLSYVAVRGVPICPAKIGAVGWG